MRRTVPLADRFWHHVDRSSADGCWPWRGHVLRTGYCRFRVGGRAGRMLSAHVVAVYLRDGTWPAAGMQVDHLCHGADRSCRGGPSCLHRRCVRPDHLEVVTPKINSMRSHSGVVNALRQAAITHCPRGHAYDEANTGRRTDGRRRCRACDRARTRASYDWPAIRARRRRAAA